MKQDCPSGDSTSILKTLRQLASEAQGKGMMLDGIMKNKKKDIMDY